MTKNIELQIEELVLFGFAARDRDLIGAAMQEELTRLLMEKGLSPTLGQGAEIPRLDGGLLEVQSGAKPEAIGIQIAQNIYGGLSR